jgi:UDP-glucose 4-epimerase
LQERGKQRDETLSGHHLILGGCGFIGRHVALLLAQRRHKVVIADRLEPDFKFPPDVERRISWQRLEFASADWDRLIQQAEVIHHYVWTSLPASANFNPFGDLSANVGGTLALLEAMRHKGGGRIVFASSGGTVYGRLLKHPVPEDHPMMPITAYGAGKATAEIYLGLYRMLHGIDCRVARISNPYGPGQAIARGQGAVTTFLNRALNKHPIVIWGDGEVVRDYIHITDVAEAVVRLALRPDVKDFHTYNIGSGVGLSLNTIVAEIEKALNRRLEVRREAGRAFDVPISILDISRAKNALGWMPRLSFAEGIARTIADLRNNSPLSS